MLHRTLAIERTYPVPPSRVFAAFADPDTKRRWFVEGEGREVDEFTPDFRVGGVERSRFRQSAAGGDGGAGADRPPRASMRNDTVYLDIVPAARIVFADALASGEVRISVSLVTVELSAVGAADRGTRLRLTEQAAFLDGADGAPGRRHGWGALLDALGAVLGGR